MTPTAVAGPLELFRGAQSRFVVRAVHGALGGQELVWIQIERGAYFQERIRLATETRGKGKLKEIAATDRVPAMNVHALVPQIAFERS